MKMVCIGITVRMIHLSVCVLYEYLSCMNELIHLSVFSLYGYLYEFYEGFSKGFASGFSGLRPNGFLTASGTSASVGLAG